MPLEKPMFLGDIIMLINPGSDIFFKANNVQRENSERGWEGEGERDGGREGKTKRGRGSEGGRCH